MATDLQTDVGFSEINKYDFRNEEKYTFKSRKGLDPEMYAGFASHCVQQYQGPYEILFGVSSMADPAALNRSSATPDI